VKTVPRTPRALNPGERQFSLGVERAIFAQVPVPHGERSIAPGPGHGLFQSSSPVETTNAILPIASLRSGRAGELCVRHAAEARLLGCTRELLFRCGLIISPMRHDVAPLSSG